MGGKSGTLNSREQMFIGQSKLFIEKMLAASEADNIASLERTTLRQPLAISPVIIEDYRRITPEQRHKLRQAYYSEYGVAYFIVLNTTDSPSHGHPLFDISGQLTEDLGLYYPLIHPLEGHPESVARFGLPDATVKIYNLEKGPGATGYREQAETSEMFAPHHDGLGSGGTVQTPVLYMDSPPLFGGYTFFQNMLRLSLELARDDMEAFMHLFLPDAVTFIRPRGKGGIKVTNPVLFLNEHGNPQSVFRVASGEYKVIWRDDLPALKRAEEFLNYYTLPFSNGSSFIHFTSPGHGCFIRNQAVVHGRTPFIDGPLASQRRLLSRKWFMTTLRDTKYKHVPGIFILKEFADLFPDLFGAEYLEGEWLYDSATDKNNRIK